MLLYHNRAIARLVFTRYGSIYFRTDNVLLGVLEAVVAVILQLLVVYESPYAPRLPHHYGLHALGTVVAFVVVFRMNNAWARYWEAVTQLHVMYSKWADAFMQVTAFATHTMEAAQKKQNEEGDAKSKRIEKALNKVEQHFTVMSALAAERLAHGDTQRMEKRMEMGLGFSKQIALRRDLRHQDFTGATQLPIFQLDPGGGHQAPCLSQKWAHMTYNVRSMPTKREMAVLRSSSDRVQVVMYWLLHTLTVLSKELDIAPPIQSRMYQELSNGMLGLSMAVKIADVPLPFPYAQLIVMLLLCFMVFLPIYITAFTDSLIAVPLLSGLIFHGIWCINETAVELENPFGTDTNDVSLMDFHSRFLDLINDVDTAHVCLVEDSLDGDLQADFISRRLTKYSEMVFNEHATPVASPRVSAAPVRQNGSSGSFANPSLLTPGSPRPSESPRPSWSPPVAAVAEEAEDSACDTHSDQVELGFVPGAVEDLCTEPEKDPGSDVHSVDHGRTSPVAGRPETGRLSCGAVARITQAHEQPNSCEDRSGIAADQANADTVELPKAQPNTELVDRELARTSSRMEDYLRRIADALEFVVPSCSSGLRSHGPDSTGTAPTSPCPVEQIRRSIQATQACESADPREDQNVIDPCQAAGQLNSGSPDGPQGRPLNGQLSQHSDAVEAQLPLLC